LEAIAVLTEKSKLLIKWNQSPAGSYIACPLFANYEYCWLRDGTFTAYAMDICGEHDSAAAFYGWVDMVLSRKHEQVQGLMAKKAAQQWIDRGEFLNTRYHLDGRDDDGEWGHFQLDGYGTWLWGLVQHIKRTGKMELLERYRGTVELTVQYISAFWPWPNYDCWEEYPDYVHPSTLACLYGGLTAVGELEKRPELLATAAEIKKFMLEYCVHDGHFVKSVVHQGGSWQPALSGVDASLLWLAVPFGAFGVEEPAMQATLKLIEAELYSGGGMHRYKEDTYYGGGAWLLLTAWYGLVLAEQGKQEEAQRCLEWIASQADELGRMPEQTPVALHDEAAYRDWVARWGMPAVPLLWSHAMFLVLSDRLKRA
jgi:GH15 family glucan-1,4-alpha-glucosidase